MKQEEKSILFKDLSSRLPYEVLVVNDKDHEHMFPLSGDMLELIIECGYKDNADFNAAKNIRNRVLVTVLRESLLKQLDNGAFEPKKLKRETVKEVLLSFRRNLQKVGSECTESSMTTFDYV